MVVLSQCAKARFGSCSPRDRGPPWRSPCAGSHVWHRPGDVVRERANFAQLTPGTPPV
ncbi:hypothetical protein HMPREF0972_02284 [Actinomyces sp. oral taxon 848 str. F0332]|nr:hypothetical protein HMPREF0972_02284 [Actinomyces sp. oral taxon 848 str. F0332]